MVKCEKWRYKADNAKPCPFCGGTSVSVRHAERRYLAQSEFGEKKLIMKAYCTCNKCHARSKPIVYVGYTGNPYIAFSEDRLPVYAKGAEAVAAWNERATDEQTAEKEKL